jgi:hypothetical protein
VADNGYFSELGSSATGTEQERALVERVIRDFEDAKRHHDTFVSFVERMYRAYRAVLDKRSEAAQWTSKLHPAYGLQLVESVVANMIDDKTTFMMKPRPLIDDPQRVEDYLAGAKALENIVAYEMEMDRFSRKQRPAALQNSITGLTVMKVAWDYAEAACRQYIQQEKEIRHPETDEVIGTFPMLVEQEHTRIVRDGPNCEVVDVRDFFWPENAQDVQGAKFIIHRVWMSLDELRDLQKKGVYKNVDKLTQTRDIQKWEGQVWRSDELFLTNRKREMIEVLEYWGPDNQVITVGNRRVLLDAKDNPFHHGKRPFVAWSSMPQPFQFVGVSDMQIIEPLQRALWTTLNQRLDNVALLNNAIILLRDTADDQDYEFAPGEFWMVEDPTEVQLWQPNPLPAEVSLGSENGIKADMNNVTGGLGLISGQDMQSLDSETATGVSTLTSIAQRRLQARRQQFAYAYEDIGNQVIPLIQQFMTTDRMVPITGLGGAQAFARVSPLQVQGNYVAGVVSISESLMRQERRAEAQALMTLAMQAAPLAAAVGQPLNLRQWVDDLLEAFDKDDPDRYFSAAPQPGAMGVSGAPGGGAVGAPQIGDVPGPPSQGVTAPQANDVRSPSNALSQSPALMMQRALAARGGGRNS